MDINEKLLFSVHRAGSNESVENLMKHGGYQDLNPLVNVVHRPPGLGPMLREASIVRDPKGVIIGMLATDRTEEQAQPLPWYLESIVRAVPVIDSASILQTLQSQL